jgi:hypothetical protein
MIAVFRRKLAVSMWPPRHATWLALLALTLGVQRLRTYHEPFERDVMTYAVIGHELVLGNRLYSDVLDNKPPVIYGTFGLAELVVGYGPGAIYLVNVTFGVLAMFGLYLAAAQAHGPPGGLVAALFWLVFSYDIALQGNQPNTELCLNALLSLAFAMAFPRRGVSRSWAAGAVVALASLYKPIALVLVPLWSITVVWLEAREGRPRSAWRHVAALGTPSVLAWLATLAYFWADDRLDLFTTVMFEFNRDYAGDLGGNLSSAFSPGRLWAEPLRGALPLLGLSLAGVALGLRRVEQWMPLAAWFLGAVAMVALPGHWWAHYYQLYLPPLVLGATAGLAEVARRRPPWGPRVRAVLLAGVFALGFRSLLGQLALDGDQTSRHKYGGRFIAVREVSRRASALLRDGETLYMYGIDAGVYFHTRRRPPTQALWINHLTGPLKVPLRHTLRRQLREVRPDLMVVDTRYRLDWLPAGLALWMEEEYERLPAASEMAPFQLLVRRGSPLQARVAGGR